MPDLLGQLGKLISRSNRKSAQKLSVFFFQKLCPVDIQAWGNAVTWDSMNPETREPEGDVLCSRVTSRHGSRVRSFANGVSGSRGAARIVPLVLSKGSGFWAPLPVALSCCYNYHGRAQPQTIPTLTDSGVFRQPLDTRVWGKDS